MLNEEKRKPLSEETKLKISKATKGVSKPMTEEHKKNYISIKIIPQ
jgi:hypothetical protein